MLNIEHEVCETRTIRILAVSPITPTLLGLPTELELQIISHLDYPSSLALSQTNKQLRAITTVQTPRTSIQKMAYLNAVETWQRNIAKFACKYCLKLRPSHSFADNQVTGKRGKNCSESDRRLCLDCGFRKRIYQPGQPIVVNGRNLILCCLCQERRRYGLYCMLCWRCESCFAKYSMPKIPFHTSLDQYIRLHGCPRCSHHLEDLGSPQMESQMTFEEVLLRMKMRGEEGKGKEKEEVEVASPWYEDYR